MIVNIDGGFLDSHEARIPSDDGSVLFGDTLFETLKVRDKKILFMDEHLDRLKMSAGLLEIPCDRQKIKGTLERTVPRLTSAVSRLRLILTRGSYQGLEFPPPKAARFMIHAMPATEPTDDERQAGAACVYAPNRRVNPLSHLPQMKRGNYADCLYAAVHARNNDAREALFVTEQNHVIEGATSNLFIIRNASLMTPPAGELVLAGIMRRQVLLAAEQLGIPAQESDFTREELLGAEEAFLTNSLIDVLPIASVAGQPIARGERWRELLEVIREAGEK